MHVIEVHITKSKLVRQKWIMTSRRLLQNQSAVGTVGAHFDDFVGFPVQSLLECRLTEKFPSLGSVKYDTTGHIWASPRERGGSFSNGEDRHLDCWRYLPPFIFSVLRFYLFDFLFLICYMTSNSSFLFLELFNYIYKGEEQTLWYKAIISALRSKPAWATLQDLDSQKKKKQKLVSSRSLNSFCTDPDSKHSLIQVNVKCQQPQEVHCESKLARVCPNKTLFTKAAPAPGLVVFLSLLEDLCLQPWHYFVLKMRLT